MRKKRCVLAFVMVLALTGCGPDVPDLSKLDNDMTGQYMADALLAHDKNYNDSLEYDHSVLEPTPEPTKKPAAKKPETSESPGTSESQGASAGSSGTSSEGGGATASGQGGEAAQQVSLSDLFGIPDVNVKPVTYRVKKSYGTAAVSHTAGDGKKLVVVEFRVSNNSPAGKNVNLMKQDVNAELVVDGQSMGKAIPSIIGNDLKFFKQRMSAGQKKQGILLFEVDDSLKVNNVQVNFTKGQSAASVSVK